MGRPIAVGSATFDESGAKRLCVRGTGDLGQPVPFGLKLLPWDQLLLDDCGKRRNVAQPYEDLQTAFSAVTIRQRLWCLTDEARQGGEPPA